LPLAILEGWPVSQPLHLSDGLRGLCDEIRAGFRTVLSGMATQARWARFADGADEVHQWRIAERAIKAYKETGSVKSAAGDLPL